MSLTVHQSRVLYIPFTARHKAQRTGGRDWSMYVSASTNPTVCIVLGYQKVSVYKYKSTV